MRDQALAACALLSLPGEPAAAQQQHLEHLVGAMMTGVKQKLLRRELQKKALQQELAQAQQVGWRRCGAAPARTAPSPHCPRLAPSPPR